MASTARKTNRNGFIQNSARVVVAAPGAAAGCVGIASAAPISINSSVRPRIATVDERYQSCNVEMAEVIGGNFWKPYAKKGERPWEDKSAATAAKSNSAPFQIGQDSSMFEPQPRIDLSNVRLPKPAAALGSCRRLSRAAASPTSAACSSRPWPRPSSPPSCWPCSSTRRGKRRPSREPNRPKVPLVRGGWKAERNPKSEGPKSEGNPKSEGRRPDPIPHSVRSPRGTESPVASVSGAEPMPEGLASSAFGFRISDFGPLTPNVQGACRPISYWPKAAKRFTFRP